MSELTLFEAVTTLSQLSHTFTDADLGQPWTWRAHKEGVRFALLGTYHEMRDLAVTLAAERAKHGPPITVAQRALAPYHAAYRDLQAVIIGIDEETCDRVPSPGEWTLRQIIGHIVGTKRHFFTLVHYGLARQRDGGDRPARVPDGEVDRIVGPYAAFDEMRRNQNLAELLAYYAALHQRALDEFSTISDEEIMGPSLWWEDEEYPLQYRLHRFDAHLRQHTIQAEKTLETLGRSPNEARRLLRLVYQALADVEGTVIGAPDLGTERCQALAEAIVGRAEDVAKRVTQAWEIVAAVEAGETDRVDALLKNEPQLVNVIDQNQLTLVLSAAYRRNQETVSALVDAGATLFIFEATAVGRLDIVKRAVARWPEVIDLVGRDGFTPLQLACFFGHEDIALWLIERGADINAIAQNQQRITPAHAAAAAGNLTILGALLENGADANARQQNDFTPLHTAAASGNARMTQLLLDHGAEISALSGDGQTPLDLAISNGHEALSDLLR